jgi:hypothetical protein
MCLFGGFFPRKKEMPRVLGKLVEAFDTPEDPTLLLKRSSTIRGAEATIALAMSQGENVNLAKLSSYLAQDEGDKAVEMKAFFIEAKKYSQNLMSLILPVQTPSSAAPSLSAPPVVETTPSEVA